MELNSQTLEDFKNFDMNPQFQVSKNAIFKFKTRCIR